MGRRMLLVAGLLACLATQWGCLNLGPLLSGRIERVVVKKSPRWFERNRIAIVDVEGFLGGDGWMTGRTTVGDVREKLDRAAADPRVRAIVLRIDSPGGSVAASDMIYEQVREFRLKTDRPVVAALLGTAASGGYYVALAADSIVASPVTVTGSVGAVMHLANVEGLLGKIGVRTATFKSGKHKDIGSPTRAMTDEEREMLESLIRSYAGRFLDTVRARRPQMSAESLATIADGRVMNAEQALELGLVDSVGYLDDAIAEAQRRAGISHADVILYRPFPHYNANVYARASAQSATIGQKLARMLAYDGPALLYLWAPGL